MKSMTGFATVTSASRRCVVVIEIRSVNHRFLDLKARLPSRLGTLEAKVRKLVQERIGRGRLDMTVRVESTATERNIEIDRGDLKQLAEVVSQLQEEGVLERGLSPADLLRTEVLSMAEKEEDLDEIALVLLEGIGRALDELQEARLEEGSRLAAAILVSLSRVEELLSQVRELAADNRARSEEVLRERLAKLLSASDPDQAQQRIATEVALLLDRLDVQEELDRLVVHCNTVRTAVGSDRGPAGKRLDFLTQEIRRELNTLAVKSRNAEISGLLVEAKVACEQIHEQLQNVE